MQKVQITLTPEEVSALSVRSKQLGFSVSKYIRFLVAKEAHDVVSQSGEVEMMSPELEKIATEALRDLQKGKVREITSLDELDPR